MNAAGLEASTVSAAGEASPKLAVNLAVCGIFHYRHYVRYLTQAGVLRKFYYSHRRATNAKSLQIAPEQAVNLPLKEYLTHGHLRLINHRLGNLLFPLYQDFFDRGVARQWIDCDVAHVMLHGGSERTISHAKHGGSIVVGEPVNSHPEFVQQLLREEHQRLGVADTVVRELNCGQKRTADEADTCDFLLTPSSFVARSYVERGYPSDRTRVVPWGTDLAQFSPGARNHDGAFRVLCVAQISTRKGHIDLLDACRLLNLPDLQLVFIGAMTPEMSAVLSHRTAEFEYRGTVPHSDLVHEFRQADVVVLPSIEDGFSYVPLEAMACGVPVIVSENAGASELVEEGETGFVVPIRNPEIIAKRLEEVYQQADRRREMGIKAAKAMQRSHGWQAYADSLVNTYIELNRMVRSA